MEHVNCDGKFKEKFDPDLVIGNAIPMRDGVILTNKNQFYKEFTLNS